jgi:serine protease SohB
MEFLIEYGLFLAKTLTIIIGILIILGVGFAMAKRNKEKQQDTVEVKNLNKHFEEMAFAIKKELMNKNELKKYFKSKKSDRKEKQKSDKKKDEKKNNVYVLNFKGDIKASAVNTMREEINAILNVAKENDEVLLKLESSGGTVNGYGLAASQLERIKSRNIPLTVSVDKVAASGGYMMAAVANNLIAAPFSVIGSIGVVAQVPNFHKLLKKNQIDFEMVTAGEYKRTLTMFGENTDKARQKVEEQVEEAHSLFKHFISKNRETLEIDKVATGEYWYGTQAKELGLIDEIKTSDDYLIDKNKDYNLFQITYKGKKSLTEKISSTLESTVSKLVDSLLNKSNEESYQ